MRAKRAETSTEDSNPQSPIPRRAFTLLEVILSLALASLVLMAVAIAIDVHLRALDASRTKVEEAQLARSVLRLIADDLRNVVKYDPANVEKLLSGVSGSGSGSQSSSGGESSESSAAKDASGSEGASGSEDSGASEDTGESESDRSSSLAESSMPSSVPGLFGNRYEIQIDTSRLPRLDQMAGAFSEDGALIGADRLSDVKTVTYYVAGAQTGALATGLAGAEVGGGLVRRELDRATAIFASEQGGLAVTEFGDEPIAPEVAAIEFRYFDGSEWLDEWDSVSNNGLPLAVEVAVAIIPQRNRGRQVASLQSPTSLVADAQQQWLVYRLLVFLPMGGPNTSDQGSTSGQQSSSETSGDSSQSSSEQSSGQSSESPSGSSPKPSGSSSSPGTSSKQSSGKGR